jgi:hypothetical protein
MPLATIMRGMIEAKMSIIRVPLSVQIQSGTPSHFSVSTTFLQV